MDEGMDKLMKTHTESQEAIENIIKYEGRLTNEGLKQAIEYLNTCQWQRTNQENMRAMSGMDKLSPTAKQHRPNPMNPERERT